MVSPILPKVFSCFSFFLNMPDNLDSNVNVLLHALLGCRGEVNENALLHDMFEDISQIPFLAAPFPEISSFSSPTAWRMSTSLDKSVVPMIWPPLVSIVMR